MMEEQKTEIKKTKLEALREYNEEIKRILEEREALLKRSEEMESKKVLSGVTDAGQTPIKHEETPQEYKNRVLSGKI